MGHDKLRKFAENESFGCLLQPDCSELLKEGFFALKDHPVKGHWGEFFTRLGGRPSDLVLELGCGKGEYTIDMAQRYPSANYIGVDIKGARLWKGAKYATVGKLLNVGFLRSRIEFISAFFGPDEVSEIWLTFSDPQFKSENCRLSSPVFLQRYRGFLKKGGKIRLKTDSRFLFEYTKAVCAENGLKVLACNEDLYGTPGREAPEVREVQTFYESMFLEQGYKITYLEFTLDDAPEVLRSPSSFDAEYWRSVEGPRLLFGHDSSETRRQKLKNENR